MKLNIISRGGGIYSYLPLLHYDIIYRKFYIWLHTYIYLGDMKMENKKQIEKILYMRDALVNNDKETQKKIVREYLSNMWVKQLSTDINNVYKEA